MSSSIRLISGRVPVTDLGNLTADRYQFLGLNQAEPNLGNSTSPNDLLTLGTDGVRVWTNAVSVVSVSASSNITTPQIVTNNIRSDDSSFVNIEDGLHVEQGLIVVGSVDVTGNVTANNGMFTNIVNTASFTGGSVSVTGNVRGGNLTTAGEISATANIYTSGYFVGLFAGSITGNLAVPGSNTQVLFNNSGNAGASTGQKIA